MKWERQIASVDVAVAAGLFAGMGGAMQIGDDGLEISNEYRKPFGLGSQSEQFLFEIQIEGQGAGQIERKQ
jgi:hypothetical protein